MTRNHPSALFKRRVKSKEATTTASVPAPTSSSLPSSCAGVELINLLQTALSLVSDIGEGLPSHSDYSENSEHDETKLFCLCVSESKLATDCMLGSQPNHGWQLCFPL